MLATTMACFVLLHCGLGIEVNEEVQEVGLKKTVNVTNLDTKPWVPLSAEDLARTSLSSVEAQSTHHVAPPRPRSPDHEAYIQQEISRMLQKLHARDNGKRGYLLRSREGQHEDDAAQGSEGVPQHEEPVKYVYEPQPQEDGDQVSGQVGSGDDFQKYLQTYLPHLSSGAGPEEVVNSYTGAAHGQLQYQTEEKQRLYPQQSLGNSIQAPHKAAGTHLGGEFVLGKGLADGGYFKPHDYGLYAAVVAEGLSQKPLKFESDVKNTRLTGGSDWSGPPVPHRSSPHPYPFHTPSLPVDLHKGLVAPPVKSHHPQRSQTMGLLKKALNMLAAFIPLGLFLAALTPNVIHINSTNPGTPTRQRSADAGVLDDLDIYPIFGLIEEYGYDSLDDPNCENRIFCEISRLGSLPSGNAVQKGFWQLALNTPEDVAESLDLKEVFKAVRTDACSIYHCEKRRGQLQSSEQVKENTTEVITTRGNYTDKATNKSEKKKTEGYKLQT